MGLAKRFWDSVTPAEGEYDFYAGRQVHLMPGGDIDGFDSSPGSHDHAQGSTLLNQWGRASFIQRWLCLSSVQAALGASDRGEVQEQADMSSDPLAVDQNQIRLRLQFGKGLYQNRCFPEREETGDVGKRGLPFNHGAF